MCCDKVGKIIYSWHAQDSMLNMLVLRQWSENMERHDIDSEKGAWKPGDIISVRGVDKYLVTDINPGLGPMLKAIDPEIHKECIDRIFTDKPGPGKFEGNHSLKLSEELHDIVGNGACNEDLGDVQDFGWFGLILTHDNGKSYIVSEDSNGFFRYREYDTEDLAQEAWKGIEREYSIFWEEDPEENQTCGTCAKACMSSYANSVRCDGILLDREHSACGDYEPKEG
jgi:hypothetical protein